MNAINKSFSNFVFLSELCLNPKNTMLFQKTHNLLNLFSRQFSLWVMLSAILPQPKFNGVSKILFRRNVFKINNSIIQFLPIDMITLKFGRTFSFENF